MPVSSRTASAAIAVALVASIMTAAPKKAAPSVAAPPQLARAMKLLTAPELRADIRFLSDDLLEGRAPGTPGDELAMKYIAARFEALGLEPAGDNGTFIQKVPLIGVTTVPDTVSVAFVRGSERLDLIYLDDYVLSDLTQQPSNPLDSDLVFVGHGVIAPEYRWDDYKGIDVRGKTLVMLVDDPPASAAEPDLFQGKTRTYYGRWTYKFEIASRLGATGAILIHTNEAAGYPWTVVRNSWGREQDFPAAKAGEHYLRMASWITLPVATKLFEMSGKNLDELTRAAASRDFHPVALDARLAGSVTSRIRPIETGNVIAKLPGSDLALKRQAVLYTAHHDHLGVGKPKNGDAIYNGAIDNASGCAVLLALARAWVESGLRPPRSIYFVSVAAEEQGLLGSEFLADHPPVPAREVALDINFDMVYPFGAARNVMMRGIERTTFSPVADRVAKKLGMRIDPDDEPEQGHYFRSDHFSLGRHGIPAFSIDPGTDIAGKPDGWGMQQKKEFRINHYHQPSDEFHEGWNYDGVIQVAQLGLWLGWEAARITPMPDWKKGDAFHAVRHGTE
jgi:Zn-dependent M28 family amino/carboxypeptidase